MADEAITVEAPVVQGPALSATSDMPVVEKPADPPPVNTEVNTAAAPKVEASEIADADAEADTETSADDAGQDDEDTTGQEPGKAKAEIPPYAKREITKARNQKREAQAQAAADRAAREAAEARLDLLLKSKAEPEVKTKAAETPRPKRESFDNPDAYDAALVSWAAENAAKSTAAEIESQVAQKAAEEKRNLETAERQKQAKERINSWSERRSQFLKDHPDYEEVAESDDLKISPVMTDILLEADNGPELAYALGKDPDLAAKISQLSPAKAAIELGRLAASVEAAKKPKVSKTPPPVKPIGSRANAGQKSVEEMSMDEYAAMRTPQIIADRLGPMARHRAN